MLIASPRGPGIVYKLSGDNIVHTNVGSATAGLRINTDGTTDELVDVSYSQINPVGDWVRPLAVSAVDHWVKFERISGDTLDFTGTLSTWLQVSGGSGSNREIKYSTTVADRSGVYSVEIATDSGGANVVAGPTNYTISANASS